MLKAGVKGGSGIRAKKDIGNIIVLGFAIFAMFFGAGNLIFPPYLGLETGDQWPFGFLAFAAIECGMTMLSLLAAFRCEGGLGGIARHLGKPFSGLVVAAIALCMGPLVVVPRTAATMYELAIRPNFIGAPVWIPSAIYFILVALLCIRPTKLAGIVGKALAPVLMLSLAILMYKAFATPLGGPRNIEDFSSVLKTGLEAGYQTMDMMGALLLSVVVLGMARQQGYESSRKRLAIAGAACLIASLALFLVYAALTYLGASASQIYSTQLDRAELLLALSQMLLPSLGLPVMALIVTSACVTTAIGFISASAQCFAQLSGGRLKYVPLVVAACALSFFISTLGISSIIDYAAPLLELVYPVIITLVLLSFFDGHIRREGVYRGAALMAFLVAALTLIDRLIPASLGTDALPLAGIGLQWLFPAALGGAAGGLLSHVKSTM